MSRGRLSYTTYWDTIVLTYSFTQDTNCPSIFLVKWGPELPRGAGTAAGQDKETVRKLKSKGRHLPGHAWRLHTDHAHKREDMVLVCRQPR